MRVAESHAVAPLAPPDPAVARAVEHLVRLQDERGLWEAEMVWNSMLLSQWVLVQRMLGLPIEEQTRQKIVRHYQVTRRPDGSWGMHGESGGYLFMTSLGYVALRALGLPAAHPLCEGARRWIAAQPRGVLAVPSWGKLWLAMVGLYGWEGVNPVPPELFLFPDFLPIHPNNFYCHTRYIYLAIAFLYGKRFTADLGPLTDELRAELYDQPFAQIDFAAHRHDLAQTDLYVRPSRPLRFAYDALAAYEKLPFKPFRKRALNHCLQRIEYEQEASRGQGLSPVNGLLDCLALYSVDPQHPLLAQSLAAMQSWKWEDEAEGIRYCGAHSTSWDTAFVLRALSEADLPSSAPAVVRGYAWLRDAQMASELPGPYARERREPIVGGWCFSDGEHRWAVSDCTAEALSSLLALHERPALLPDNEPRLPRERQRQAVEFILRRQNDDGGFGSYERRRGSVLLEAINPSEMYGNCMTERSYTECTASCVAALARARAAGVVDGALDARVQTAVARGVALIRARQLPDGSYAGFWGVNFTYAIFHVIEALRAAGVPRDDGAVARAAEWLLSKQKADGGWGEHWSSCLTDSYVEHAESQAAMTAWALLALLEVIDAAEPALARAAACLRVLQRSDGSWPHQAQSGVFFSTAMLDYRLYKDVFPAWALARYSRAL